MLRKSRSTLRSSPKQTYDNIVGGTDPFVDLGHFASAIKADNTPFYCPISSDEDLAAIHCIGRGYALQWLANAIMFKGKIPDCLKSSATTFIPKTSEPEKLKDIGQWRTVEMPSIVPSQVYCVGG